MRTFLQYFVTGALIVVLACVGIRTWTKAVAAISASAWEEESGDLQGKVDELEIRLVALRDSLADDIAERILLERRLGLAEGRLSTHVEKTANEILELSELLRHLDVRIREVKGNR